MGQIRIEEVKQSDGREYVAADKDQINFARFYILESDRKRKNVLLHLKLLRAAGDHELTELLTRIFQAMTKRERSSRSPSSPRRTSTSSPSPGSALCWKGSFRIMSTGILW